MGRVGSGHPKTPALYSLPVIVWDCRQEKSASIYVFNQSAFRKQQNSFGELPSQSSRVGFLDSTQLFRVLRLKSWADDLCGLIGRPGSTGRPLPSGGPLPWFGCGSSLSLSFMMIFLAPGYRNGVFAGLDEAAMVNSGINTPIQMAPYLLQCFITCVHSASRPRAVQITKRWRADIFLEGRLSRRSPAQEVRLGDSLHI